MFTKNFNKYLQRYFVRVQWKEWRSFWSLLFMNGEHFTFSTL